MTKKSKKLNWIFSSHTPKGKSGEKIRFIFGVFRCVIMNIHNKKLVHDALNKLGGKHTF
jgi:hypothetical protein